jgi:hypothetical protein
MRVINFLKCCIHIIPILEKSRGFYILTSVHSLFTVVHRKLFSNQRIMFLFQSKSTSRLGRSRLGRSRLGRSRLGRSRFGRSRLGHSWLGRILKDVAPGLVVPGLVVPGSVGVPFQQITLHEFW